MKRVLSLLFLFGLLATMTAGQRLGTPNRNPWEVISYSNSDLNAMMQGAPPFPVVAGVRDANGFPQVCRIDFNHFTAGSDSTGTTQLSKWTSGSFLYTDGGGVPDSSVDRMFLTSGSGAGVGWTLSGKDSSENVIMAKLGFPSLSDSLQVWFLVQFKKTIAGASTQIFGLSDGMSPYGGTVDGSPFEPGTWDGTFNDSHEGSIYFELLPVTTVLSDSLKTVNLIAHTSAATETTAINFATPVAPLAGQIMTFAFHAYGHDSVRWFAVDTTGVADISSVFTSTAGLPATMIFGNQAEMGEVLDNTVVTFYEWWMATAPY